MAHKVRYLSVRYESWGLAFATRVHIVRGTGKRHLKGEDTLPQLTL